MQFTSAIAVAILAYTAKAAPYNPPSGGNGYSGSSSSASATYSSAAPSYTPSSTWSSSNSSSSSSSSSSVVIAPPAQTPLTLTQQLFIADQAGDRFSLLPNDSQFVFDFNNETLKTTGQGLGGTLVAANRKNFPALVGAGSGMAVGELGPCGFNTPHVHPRATELQIVVSGQIITEMVPENAALVTGPDGKKTRRVVRNTVNPFQMTPFYQGSIHTQFNPGCDNATFIASFNSEDFGAGQALDEIFALSDDVIQAAFGQAVSGADVDKFQGKIPTTIAEGVEQCLMTCGLSKN